MTIRKKKLWSVVGRICIILALVALWVKINSTAWIHLSLIVAGGVALTFFTFVKRDRFKKKE